MPLSFQIRLYSELSKNADPLVNLPKELKNVKKSMKPEAEIPKYIWVLKEFIYGLMNDEITHEEVYNEPINE